MKQTQPISQAERPASKLGGDFWHLTTLDTLGSMIDTLIQLNYKNLQFSTLKKCTKQFLLVGSKITSPFEATLKKNMKKTLKLRNMLTNDTLEFLMEAHNGLCAKIVEEAEFRGIWASGLSISASLGVRDSNEASWTQILEVLEFMSDATEIPILLDGDTGYGNFNNMRRLVKKLEQRDIAGVCIEDKLFPKTNSYIQGERQMLAPIDEFCGKIKAGKDAAADDDFCIVARIEAFITGWGLEEAIKRAELYRKAGADAILVHSKKSHPKDIETFMKEWNGRHPIIIVPTTYYSTPTDRFKELNISMIIWANQSVRSSITAIKKTVTQIRETNSIVSVEDAIAPVSEVFRLQGEDELREAEKRYLPKSDKNVAAIVLAASQGVELESITLNKPKAMIEINGKPILFALIHTLNKISVKNITVVRGFKKEQIQGTNFITIDNNRYDTTTDLYSLYLAKDKISDHCFIIYGDTLVRKHILLDLLQDNGDFAVVIDAEIKNDSSKRDYVYCTKPYTNDFFNKKINLLSVASNKEGENADGEWTGILYVNTAGSKHLKEVLEELSKREDFYTLSIVDLLNILAKRHTLSVVYTKGGWIDVDNACDIERAGNFYS